MNQMSTKTVMIIIIATKIEYDADVVEDSNVDDCNVDDAEDDGDDDIHGAAGTATDAENHDVEHNNDNNANADANNDYP